MQHPDSRNNANVSIIEMRTQGDQLNCLVSYAEGDRPMLKLKALFGNSEEEGCNSACPSYFDKESTGDHAEANFETIDQFDSNKQSAQIKSCGLKPDTNKHIARTYAANSEIGHRVKNDDCVLMGTNGDIFAISDGIGGAPDGDYMSRVACGAAIDHYESHGDLQKAFKFANDCAVNVAEWIRNPDCGATLLLGALNNHEMEFAWIGDSVAYHYHNNQLKLITSPGRISKDGNALTGAIGYSHGVIPNNASCQVSPGDFIILCTDGVWDTYENILGISMMIKEIEGSSDIDDLVRSITRETSIAGNDNASAIVIAFKDVQAAPLNSEE